MPRLAQAPPPGIARNGTAEATAGRWFDASNMRWRGGVILPVGGNSRLDKTVVPGLPRDCITWHTNNYDRWAAFGTDAGLYAYNFTNQGFYDITPPAFPVLGVPGFKAGYGNGKYSSGPYGISSGKSPSLDPPPTGGFVANYGAGNYGAHVYGISGPRAAAPPGIGDMVLPDWWSMDLFGEILMFVQTLDGHLYSWDPKTPTVKPVIVAGAPVKNRGVIVTDQRHVVLYGAAGDPRKIAWSDQENPNVWAADVTNLAGEKQLVTTAAALTACKIGSGILLFTTNDVHAMTYVGAPYAYGITQIATGCGPISPRSVVAVGSMVAWMSLQNFWIYQGNVQPLMCEVKDWFFDTLNPGSATRLFGSPNPQFAEIWWDFPDENAVNGENNRYLAFNYGASGKPYWLIGYRNRSSGDRNGTLDYPILGGPSAPGASTGALFQHETGWTDSGAPRASAGKVWLESGTIVIGEGDRRHHVKQVVFDSTSDPSAPPPFGFRFLTKEQPYDAVETDTGLYTEIDNGLMDVRFSGRSTRLRIEALIDAPFDVGRPRLEVKAGGRR